jgi:hypothetical protein
LLAWPIEACVRHCKSTTQLYHLIEVAREGKLGTLEHWETAEKRWDFARVSYEEIAASAIKEELPVSPMIARQGFPWQISKLVVDDVGLHANAAWLLAKAATGSHGRVNERPREIAAFAASKVSPDMRPRALVDLYYTMLAHAVPFHPPSVLAGIAAAGLDQTHLDLCDQIGKAKLALSYCEATLGDLSPAVFERLVNHFSQAYVAHPECIGLMTLLSYLDPRWIQYGRIPSYLLSAAGPDEDGVRTCARWVLSMDQLQWGSQAIPHICAKIVRSLTWRPGIVSRICRVVLTSQGRNDAESTLLTGLLGALPDDQINATARTQIIDTLDALSNAETIAS